MGIRSLISFGLLLVPIAITVGVLCGLDAYRSSTGQPGLFVDNSVKTEIYCDKSYGIHPKSAGEEYTLNPNPWGWDPAEGGSSCLHVVTHKNGSYATNVTAPEFWVTWQYNPKDPNEPVHGYPNIMLDTEGVFPARISDLKSINVDIKWGYSVGSEPKDGFDLAGLTADTAAANVAMDMFLDSDQSNAQNPEKAKFEVMVWLGYFNPATQPLGMAAGVRDTQVVDGKTFQLYYGQNQQGQYVLSWYATDAANAVTELKGDLTPFITKLPSIAGITAPSASDYLGYMSLGTETLFSTSNVTFSVPRLSMELVH